MSPLTFLELEAALLVVGLLCELAIATFVLKGFRRRPAAGGISGDKVGSYEPIDVPADWEPPSAALVLEPQPWGAHPAGSCWPADCTGCVPPATFEDQNAAGER